MRNPHATTRLARIATLLTVLALIPQVLVPLADAQGDGPPSTTVYLDVTGMGGDSSLLTIGYPDDADLGTVLEDVKAVADVSGWATGAATATPPDQSRSYEVGITPGISVEDGQPPIYPFIHAFRRFPTIEITLIGESTGPEGEFSGENRFLSAEWRRVGNVTIFTYQMRDRGFDSESDVVLTDGQTEDDPIADEPVTPAPRPSRPSTWHLWVLLALASVGAGIFAWGLTWWALSRLSPGINAPEKKGNQPPLDKVTEPSASHDTTDADDGIDAGPGEAQ